MIAFGKQGAPEEETMKHLSDLLDKNATLWEEAQRLIQPNSLFNAIRAGDLEKVRDIVSRTEERVVPFSEGQNQESASSELMNLPYYYWSAVISMIHAKEASE